MKNKILALLIAASMIGASSLDARGGGGHGGGFHGGGHGGGFHGGHGGGHGWAPAHHHGGYQHSYIGHHRYWPGVVGSALVGAYFGAWALGDPWPYADEGPWYYYIPGYWDEIPYFGSDYAVVIDDDDYYWDFTNDSDDIVTVGNYRGTVRGKLKPGQTARVPRKGDDRYAIGRKNTQGKSYADRETNVSITNDMFE
jgi:hypothetical protein